MEELTPLESNEVNDFNESLCDIITTLLIFRWNNKKFINNLDFSNCFKVFVKKCLKY